MKSRKNRSVGPYFAATFVVLLFVGSFFYSHVACVLFVHIPHAFFFLFDFIKVVLRVYI